MSTTANKIVKVTHISPDQKVIRCTASVDMPEYDIKAGDVFFLSRSSEKDTFYVVVFDSEQNKYVCGHPTSKKAKICTHVNEVSAHCHARATRNKPIPLAERGSLNGNRAFDLFKKAS